MDVAKAPMATEPGISPNLDLKRSLTLRVVAVALACFLVSAALAVLGTYRDIGKANESVANDVIKQLQNQLFRIESDSALSAQFPDWTPVAQRVQNAGQCIQFVDPDGSISRSSCVGIDPGNGVPQTWFSSLGKSLLVARTDIARAVPYGGKTYGTVIVTMEGAAVLAAVWNDVSGLLGLTALVVGAICLLQYVAISRALRPTKEILVGLDRLARGDLSYRLPKFRLIELQRISEVFNTLAAGLERTTRERTALAARLVDGQEQERRHLARELHDELAQNLSAISARAASIKATAETECPGLLSEANSLSQTSMAMMKTLRSTLQALRPPEIDDFGLAASLASLAKAQERRAAGKLKILVDVEGNLQGLPPTAASHVYRIVQEGLTNIGKHANASRARVALDIRPKLPERAASQRRWMALTIEDNGCGAVERREGVESHGFGLVGMRERVMALGGQLDVIDLGGRGFKLYAMIPFDGPSGPLP
jgi:signal transduction histidine kinase